MIKTYLTYENVNYWGYEAIGVVNLCDTIMYDVDFAERLSKLKGVPNIDNTIHPAIGSSVYVYPGCPVAIDDIRKNYKIKRGVDNGDYNVFYPTSITHNYGWHTGVVIFPSRKLIVFLNYKFRGRNRTEICNEAQEFLRANGLDSRIDSDCVIIENTIKMYCTICPEIFESLLNGDLKKPCIGCEQLDYSTGNDLTVDALYLTYVTGSAGGGRGSNEEKHRLQLEALNQTNWREYPATIDLLFNKILYYCNPYRDMRSRPSSFPKTVKQFLRPKQDYIEKKADFELGKAFLKMLLNLDGTKFVKFTDLTSKLFDYHISHGVFEHYFNDITRITEKEFEEDV